MKNTDVTTTDIASSDQPDAGRRKLTKQVIGALAGATVLAGAPYVRAQNKIKLTYWSRDYNHGSAVKYAQEFMKANPRYDISVEGLPFTGMWEKVNTALLGGKAADIFSAVLTWVPALAELDLIHPIDNLWMRDVSASDRADYFATGIDSVTYKNRFYGMPWRVDGNIMLWSMDAFREAGLDPMKAPDTWNELATYAGKLVTNRGGVQQQGIGWAGKPLDLLVQWYFYPILWSNGGDVTDDKVQRSLLDSKASVDAFTFLTDLNRKQKAATPEVFNLAWSDLSPLLAKRSIAMALGHQANIDSVMKVTPGMKLAAGPFPSGPAGRFSNGTGWCHLIAKTAKLDEAWPFLQYLQDPARQAVLTVGAPGRKAGLSHPKYDVLRQDPALKYAVTSGSDTARSHPLAKNPKSTEVAREIGVALSEAWQGKLSPADAAQLAHRKVGEMLKA